MRRRRGHLILALLLICPLLLGAGLFEVQLRNTDERNPLVRVDALIGGKSMPDPTQIPQTEETKAQEEESPKPEEPEPETPEPAENAAPVAPPKIMDLTVRVEARNIYINDSIVVGMPFDKQFAASYNGTQKVILVDAYAEYHTYETVLEVLREKGIRYEERRE
ncbi:MAG: hypothetical protein IJT34_03060 [Butyrivibrio sp.]|nr:hypothetical protein [Butyrivibrio sp.]